MRRFARLAVSAAALTAALGLTAGTASAATDSTWNHGGAAKSGPSITALAAPVGAVHNFSATTKGAALTGKWYFYHGKDGKSLYVWLTMTVRDTKADGLRAAVCFKSPLTTSPAYCYWNKHGYKTSFTVKGWLHTTDHFVYSVEVGKPKDGTFYWWHKSPWKQVR